MRRELFAALLIVIVAISFPGCSDDDTVIPPLPTSQDDLSKRISIASADLQYMIADRTRPYLYISDATLNCVYFLNTSTYQVENCVNVGMAPTIMDTQADNSHLFVILTGGTRVAIIDLNTQTALAPIDVPSTPTSITAGANDQLYVSTTSSPVSVFDISSLPAVALSPMSVSEHVCGRSRDRMTLYTHGFSTALQVRQWDISGGVPTEIRSEDIFSGPPRLVSSPDGAKVFLTDDYEYFGPRFSDGMLPVFATSNLGKIGQFEVEWTPYGVDLSLTGDSAYVAHDSIVVNPVKPVPDRHDVDRKDLHIFDTSTYAELGHYILPSFVRKHGVHVGPDGRIYLLLGRSAADEIGVIVP